MEILEQGEEWHKVRHNGCTGYSAARYISVSGVRSQEEKFVGRCTGDGVRVRSTPDFGDNVIHHLNKGNLFDVLEVSSVWTHISVEGKEGYIYSDYVERV